MFTPVKGTTFWLPLPGADDYQVSSQGDVRSVERITTYTSVLKPLATSYRVTPEIPLKVFMQNGYRRIKFGSTKTHHFVHRLVYETFVGAVPEGLQIRHLNGIRDDNRVENLAVGTAAENAADKTRHGTQCRGVDVPTAKLNDAAVLAIRASKLSSREQADIYGVSPGTIRAVVTGKSWAHVS